MQRRPVELLLGILRPARSAISESVGPRAALAHQLALSACMVLGVAVVDDQVLGIPWLYWTGQAAVHALTLGLVLGMLLSRAGVERPVWAERLLVLLPVLDLLVLAVCRWSVVNTAGFQGYLMAVPMVWLAARYRYPGAALGIAFTLGSMLLGLLVSPEHGLLGLVSRGLSTAVLTGVLAERGVLSSSASAKRMTRGRARRSSCSRRRLLLARTAWTRNRALMVRRMRDQSATSAASSRRGSSSIIGARAWR